MIDGRDDVERSKRVLEITQVERKEPAPDYGPLQDHVRSPGARLAVIGVLFLLAALAEIGGGWLVWQCMRDAKPSWYALLGSLVLIAYGFIPTLQPLASDEFGRVYAVYGGLFIGCSFAWGRTVDGMQLDRGDIIGGAISAVGIAVVLLWPYRKGGLGQTLFMGGST